VIIDGRTHDSHFPSDIALQVESNIVKVRIAP
jgi:hypothetical protein